MFETPARHAVRVQPARAGRRTHAGARRDGQRQELPAELPGHARAAVRPADRRPRPRAQLPEARDAAAGAATSSSASTSRRRHHQPVRPGTPTPEHLHFLHAFVAGAARGQGRLPPERPRGPRGLRGRSRTSTCSTAAQRRLFTLANLLPRALSARGCTSGSTAGATPRLFDNARRHADGRPAAGVRLRGDARVPVAARAAAVLRAAPRHRARARPGGGRHR